MNALNARLDSLQRKPTQRRTRDAIASAQGREVHIAGRALINFSSNDYLGLSADPRVINAVHEAVESRGVGSGGSALLSGRSDIHRELELRLARYMRRENALLYSSGYLANLGVLTAIVRRHDRILHDRLNHASLIDAVVLSRAAHRRYPHTDMQALENMLAGDTTQPTWIVTDSVFSMDGDCAPLDTLSQLAERAGATLIVDDAHGFGVAGEGRGSAAAFGLGGDEIPIQIVTFGKALGSAGAAVVGSDALIESLVQHSRTYIYDTAPPPMIAAATLAALEIVAADKARHQRLAKNIQSFRQRAARLPLCASQSPIQPVMIGDDARALDIAARLRDLGVYVRAIRPPTVPLGSARLRICLSAAHTSADLARLGSALDEAFQHTAA